MLSCGNGTLVVDNAEEDCTSFPTMPSPHPRKTRAAEKIVDAEVNYPQKTEYAQKSNFVPALFWGAALTYPFGIFLPLATISKHMNAGDALETAERDGSLGIFSFLAKPMRRLMDWSGANPTLVDEKNTFSLVGGLKELLLSGEVFLFLVIFLFSIAFPITKMFFLYKLSFDPNEFTRERHLKWLGIFGKWSMLDVIVIALLVVVLKVGNLVETQVHCGIYFFTASVVMTMVLTHFLHDKTEQT